MRIGKADELSDQVTKELMNYDSVPSKTNGKIDLSDSNLDFRLGQLQDKADKRALSSSEVKEAKGLLEEVGVKF